MALLVITTTLEYWRGLSYFLRGGSLQAFKGFDYAGKKDIRAEVQVRSLALIVQLWDQPHYRNGTFKDDMEKNLRNVAVPGTGVPLSLLCFSKWLVLLCLYLLLPLVCLISAFNERFWAKDFSLSGLGRGYRSHLIHPTDWFSFWRLNCRLATYHSHVTKEADYRVEDKWTFLTLAQELAVPVTPWLDADHIICKHRNEEGGLGFQHFANATHGGDWIIQQRIQNAASINALLPTEAPLSTFRVISASTGGLHSHLDQARRPPAQVRALSCVWRAGRKGAATDHKCIMFDCDLETGALRQGVTSSHWYQLGLASVLFSPWTSADPSSTHPDTGLTLSGKVIPEMPAIIQLVEEAHLSMCPGVPMVGWDVAITPTGLMLLEANLSCNFFRASFDEEAYLALVHKYFLTLEDIEQQGGVAAASKGSGPVKATFTMPVKTTSTAR